MLAVFLNELRSAGLGSGRCNGCKDMTNVGYGAVGKRIEYEITDEG